MRFLQPIGKEVRYKLRSTKLREPLVWFRHRGLGLDNEHVFLASYQRSGSTWLRFLLCEVLTKGGADFRGVKITIPDVRDYRKGPLLLGSGRLIKTHEPYRREYKKALYLVRDPRDVAVSLHAYDRPHDDMDDFVRAFVAGKASPHGTWRRNVWSWLRSPLVESENLLLVKYETLRGDTEGTLASILEFLGMPVDREIVANAVQNNSLQRMRAKEDLALANGVEVSGETMRSRGRSVRRGSVGGWMETLTRQQAELIENHAGELLATLGYSSMSTLLSQELDAVAMSGDDLADSGPSVVTEAS